MTAHALQLETARGARVALQSVAIETVITGLFGNTTINQRFVNTENQPIEAVYTFPTPHRAVFMGLEVTIGDKSLAGVVMPDAKADRGYEEAIQDGDAAVLLREVEQGLFSVSVGNILPGETIALKYTYAEQLSQQGDTVRLTIPTTIASRYGTPSAVGLEDHELITHEFDTGYAVALSVTVTGALAGCGIASPSHLIQTRAVESGVHVSLSKETAAMDRDFVLTLNGVDMSNTQGVITPNCTVHNDYRREDGQWVASAPFYLPIPSNEQTRPGVFNLIIDCSGSMGGDSIRQAKMAAMEIIDSLQPNDRFNLTAFGSHSRTAFNETLPATETTLADARRFVKSLDADMGGTEIGKAIAKACPKRAGKRDNANVLLITDGQTYDGNDIVRNHRHRGHRIFTLGVGSAVSRGFLEKLSEATGGACELVAPNERMAEHIVRHFGRMRQLRVVSGEVHWDGSPTWSVPGDLNGVFAGDTLHVGAGFTTRPGGDVTLIVQYENGTSQTLTVSLEQLSEDHSTAGVLPRVLAHQRLAQLSDQRRVATALHYQLLTEGTKCLMTHQRTDGKKAEELPELRPVPHEQPAGWGGTGSVSYADSYHVLPARGGDYFAVPVAPCDDSVPFSEGDDMDIALSDIPAFLRRVPDESRDERPKASGVERSDTGRRQKREGRNKNKVRPQDSQQSNEIPAPTPTVGNTETGRNPIVELGISRALRLKLAYANVYTIEELLATPRSDWENRYHLSDEEIVALLQALRKNGYRVK